MDLHYKTYGSGKPLIILHGLFGSLNNWRTMSKRFGEHFKVYALDQRNHGASPHSNVSSYEVMVEDLHDFVQRRGISSFHLLGHSMGGKTAMQFAVRFPEKTNSLIVVDIAPRTYRSKHDEILDALCALNVRKFSSRKEVDAALSWKIREAAVRQFLLTNLKRDEDGKFFWRINLKALRRNYGEIVKGLDTQREFTKPTLFITGGKSSYVTIKDRKLIKRIFPHSKTITIARAGHWVHAEAPEEFSEIVLEFLERQ